METFKKRIIFAGMPDMGYICLDKLIQSGVNIVGIIPPKKTDKTYQQFIEFTAPYNLPILKFDNLDDPDFIQSIKDLNADLGVVCSYNHKFPKVLLDAVKGGFLNAHPSLLPEYRGPNPYSNVIINDEKETGVTFHYMDENFDTGRVAAQVRLQISKDETMGTLFSRLNYLTADCLVELLMNFETVDGHFLTEEQPKGEFHYAKNYDLSLGNVIIDWTKTPEEIDRFIRALNPFIGAYTMYNHEFLKINSAKPERKRHNTPPGTICEAKHKIKVACNGGYITINSVQFGSYFITDAEDFIYRAGVKKGEILLNE